MFILLSGAFNSVLTSQLRLNHQRRLVSAQNQDVIVFAHDLSKSQGAQVCTALQARKKTATSM